MVIKWTWVRAAMLGAIIGPTPIPSDAAVELLRSGSGHWRDVAARSARLPSTLTREHEDEIATWIEASAGDARTSSLGFLLCLLPGMDRTCLISSWATSPSERVRRALAHALCAPFEAVGVRGAIEHLEGDPSPEIRRLARSAAVCRAASRRHPA